MLRKLPRLSMQSGDLKFLWIDADLNQQKTCCLYLWSSGDIELLSGVEKRRE